MKRAFLPLALLASSASAFAQSAYKPLGLQVHIGYGVTPDFSVHGQNRSMRGAEIGVAIPIGTFGGNGILLEPSYFGAARFGSHGAGVADVYRLTLFAHRTFARGIGARVGVGYSNSARAKRGDYDGNSDVVFDFGVEIPLQFKLIQVVAPYVDVHGVVSGGAKQLSGFFVGVGVKV